MGRFPNFTKQIIANLWLFYFGRHLILLYILLECDFIFLYFMYVIILMTVVRNTKAHLIDNTLLSGFIL